MPERSANIPCVCLSSSAQATLPHNAIHDQVLWMWCCSSSLSVKVAICGLKPHHKQECFIPQVKLLLLLPQTFSGQEGRGHCLRYCSPLAHVWVQHVHEKTFGFCVGLIICYSTPQIVEHGMCVLANRIRRVVAFRLHCTHTVCPAASC